jgi:protein-disulfide isomerase
VSKVAWIIFGAVIVLVLGGLIVWSRVSNPAADVSTLNENSVLAASDQNGQIGDHTFGKADSDVIFIEYGDFQCPSCGAAHPQVKEVTEEYEDRVAFVFRNFPLTSIHPNARAAAAAAEAAGLQGKYWEMHNQIFESQSSWSNLTGNQRTDAFVSYAQSLGLDTDKFADDLGVSAINQKISFDQALGRKASVSATPSFYLNGEKLSEADASAIVQGDSDKLRELFDAALGE